MRKLKTIINTTTTYGMAASTLIVAGLVYKASAYVTANIGEKNGGWTSTVLNLALSLMAALIFRAQMQPDDTAVEQRRRATFLDNRAAPPASAPPHNSASSEIPSFVDDKLLWESCEKAAGSTYSSSSPAKKLVIEATYDILHNLESDVKKPKP